ncbi:syntaxin-8 [Anopheles moucheti]|uniref:syntaxin-8 n=1 Tax=Anopheles moucheti TaxID=186751 RepID=UPI0022EFFF16|nr:syntaxin-8 [Anopheles moucheti]XP_052896938.1 syntaxin-8 [Anopheles moucheti]
MALINIDGDPWLTELDACENLSNDIQSQLAARNRENQLSREYGVLSGTVRVRLKQLGSELDQLTRKLGLISNTLTSGEAERRQRRIEALQSKLIQLQRQFTYVEPSAARSALFESGSNNPARRTFADDDDDEPALIPSQSNYTVADLRSQQTRILEDQNEGLEALSQVIARQKELATRIGGEVDRHNDILDDLAQTMETTDGRINRETHQIGTITTQNSTWGYWIVIGLLFVAIVLTGIF